MHLPPYPTHPVLTGDRIVLRPIAAADLEAIVPISFYDGVPAQTAAEAVAMQQHIDRDYAAGDTVHWGIALRETGVVVGTCGYYRGFAGGAGELGCVLLPGAQGQGYMTEAMQLAIAFGRQEMGLSRIWAVTTVDNAPAIRLLKRLGFMEGAAEETIENFIKMGNYIYYVLK